MTNHFENNKITHYNETYDLLYSKESYDKSLMEIFSTLDNYELYIKKIVHNTDDLLLEYINEKDGKIKEIREYVDNMGDEFKTIPLVQIKIQDIENNLSTIDKIVLEIGPHRLFFYQSLWKLKEKIENSNSMKIFNAYVCRFNNIIKNAPQDAYAVRQKDLINNIIMRKKSELKKIISNKSK